MNATSGGFVTGSRARSGSGQARPRRGRSSFFSRGSWPGRGGFGIVPGAMSGGRSAGGLARAASTDLVNARAVSAGRLPNQAVSIWRTRSVSAARRSRSRLECLAMQSITLPVAPASDARPRSV
jgi:hypothetical protein